MHALLVVHLWKKGVGNAIGSVQGQNRESNEAKQGLSKEVRAVEEIATTCKPPT